MNLYYSSNYPETIFGLYSQNLRKSECLCMIFFHSKFETTEYKFGIKVVLTGTVVQSKTFLFRTDKIIKSIYYFKEENYIVTSPIPLNVCFKAS